MQKLWLGAGKGFARLSGELRVKLCVWRGKGSRGQCISCLSPRGTGECFLKPTFGPVLYPQNVREAGFHFGFLLSSLWLRSELGKFTKRFSPSYPTDRTLLEHYL